jgi:hypothetical protein
LQMYCGVMRWLGEELQVKLSDLRAEIQESAKSPYGERLYPITSDWIPVIDVFAVVDSSKENCARSLTLPYDCQVPIRQGGRRIFASNIGRSGFVISVHGQMTSP